MKIKHPKLPVVREVLGDASAWLAAGWVPVEPEAEQQLDADADADEGDA